MPQEWQKILDENGITRAEQEENPDKVSQDDGPFERNSPISHLGPRRRAIFPKSRRA